MMMRNPAGTVYAVVSVGLTEVTAPEKSCLAWSNGVTADSEVARPQTSWCQAGGIDHSGGRPSMSRRIFHHVAHALAPAVSGRSSGTHWIGSGNCRLMSWVAVHVIPG